MKHEVLNCELKYIKDERIRTSCEIILDLLPEYFYEIPASSTGKYHPDFSLGDGGLVRHVKVAVRIAKELLDNPCIGEKYSQNEKDMMIFTLILHDGLKSGLTHEKYTRADHPTLIKEFVRNHKDKINLTENTCTIHHFSGSWVPLNERIEHRFWQFLGIKPHRVMWHLKQWLQKHKL